MEALQNRLEALEQQAEQLKHHIRITERALRWWRRMTCVLGVLALLAPPLTSVGAQQAVRSADGNPWKGLEHLEHRVAQLENEVAQLEDKLVHITSSSDEVTITGANLRIVNGLGSTNTTNGVGNLIVGYNETRGDGFTDTRTGSHNVVVGRQQNFSSFGGLVVAEFNEISGPWASVSGGLGNTASGCGGSVSGGEGNTASACFLPEPGASSVSGGDKQQSQWPILLHQRGRQQHGQRQRCLGQRGRGQHVERLPSLCQRRE